MHPYQILKTPTLEALEIPASQEQAPCIMLFHGFGADASDLVPLRKYIHTGIIGIRWIFPNGCQRISSIPGFTGRSWFPVDIHAFEESVKKKDFYKLRSSLPYGLKEACQLVKQMIQDLHIPFSKIILGGFSQGAMLATELALSSEEMPAGLLILSGALLDEKRWTELAKEKKGMPFLQSHGTEDPLLSIEEAKRLEHLLLQGGLKGSLHVFPGGHEIPQSTLNLMGPFIHSCIDKSSSSRDPEAQ